MDYTNRNFTPSLFLPSTVKTKFGASVCANWKSMVTQVSIYFECIGTE